MIEVITHPSHLAGAKVEGCKPMTYVDGEWLHIDRANASGVPLSIARNDARTRHMLPATLDLFRALLGSRMELYDGLTGQILDARPNAEDVERALALIDAAMPPATEDYRAILAGYIRIVGDAEGVDFIPGEGEASPHLTPDQLRVLREVAG